MTKPITADLIEKFIAIVGVKNIAQKEDDIEPYVTETRGIYFGKTLLVLKPANTQEVSQILKLANDNEIGVVPLSGRTGHVGGGVPNADGTEIVISIERMNNIREVDMLGNTMSVDAGVVLQTIQEEADKNDRLFPLSLGAQGSCLIGGNISTNAGGTGVLAYGNTRELVMGLEVVLASGEIWNGLRKLKKDNTGYDLRDLFVGAEGTLGIVTGAVLKLFPKPKGREVAFCGVETPEQALKLLNTAQGIAGKSLTGFEIMPLMGLQFVLRNISESRDPLSSTYPWYVLVEISSGRSAEDANAIFLEIMEAAFEAGELSDAAIAQNEKQQLDFWALREDMSESQKPEGGSIKHDISVPVHLMPNFLKRADEVLKREIPDARICGFGHMGDGNIHYNITQPVSDDIEATKKIFMAQREHINDLIHALVVEMNGSISAEHGIGVMKRDLMARTKQPVELEMMRSIKKALDPKGIMNPGKVL
ncbi:MAG: FAD-binding oxidoreductase [Rhizobiales bacterium]|nr:FAD-binding oxidoreductase [Hyphomicrobiales bacterium]